MQRNWLPHIKNKQHTSHTHTLKFRCPTLEMCAWTKYESRYTFKRPVNKTGIKQETWTNMMPMKQKSSTKKRSCKQHFFLFGVAIALGIFCCCCWVRVFFGGPETQWNFVVYLQIMPTSIVNPQNLCAHVQTNSKYWKDSERSNTYERGAVHTVYRK